jgi:hypothetical protein
MNTKTKIKPRSNLQRAEIIPVLQIARQKFQRYFEKYLKFLRGISQLLVMYSTISCGTLVGEHFLVPTLDPKLCDPPKCRQLFTSRKGEHNFPELHLEQSAP